MAIWILKGQEKTFQLVNNRERIQEIDNNSFHFLRILIRLF